MLLNEGVANDDDALLFNRNGLWFDKLSCSFILSSLSELKNE